MGILYSTVHYLINPSLRSKRLDTGRVLGSFMSGPFFFSH